MPKKENPRKQKPVLVVCHMQTYWNACKRARDPVISEVQLAMQRKERVVLLELSHTWGWNGVLLPSTMPSIRRVVTGYKRVHRLMMHPTVIDGYSVVIDHCARKAWTPSHFNVVGIHTSLCVRDLAYTLARTHRPVNVIMESCTDGDMRNVTGWSSYDDRPANISLVSTTLRATTLKGV